MRLYEMIALEMRGMAIHPSTAAQYTTSKAEAQKWHTAKVKKLKADTAHWKAANSHKWQQCPMMASGFYVIEVRTELVAADWVKLLAADAPGPACEMTPQDLITSRKQLAYWSNKKGNDHGK